MECFVEKAAPNTARCMSTNEHFTPPTREYAEFTEGEEVRLFDFRFNVISAEIHHINVDKGFWGVQKTPEELAADHAAMWSSRAPTLDDLAKFAEAARATAPRATSEIIALMHEELSEALHADRANNPPSSKIPEFSSLEEEYADVFIRLMDACYRKNVRLMQAVRAKLDYNRKRPFKHGRKY
jgi:hypothetical protein